MAINVLITGNSSGLGLGLAEVALARDWHVYGLSRRGCPVEHERLSDEPCDLARSGDIPAALARLLAGVTHLDMVILNAGVFGQLHKLAEISEDEYQHVMQVNVWANKIILDWLFSQGIETRQVIAISSGAALSANVGWGSYSISKIALNKLMALYAKEFPQTHFSALAPGLVDTAMQDYLCDEDLHSLEAFPLLKRFRDARGTEVMPSGEIAAEAILSVTDQLMQMENGCYVDIRSL